MDTRSFLSETRQRMSSDIPISPEEASRAVFQVLHERIEPGQAGHIESHLPQDLKSDWKLDAISFLRDERAWTRDDFLEAVQHRASQLSIDQAATVTSAVFGALKRALPEGDVRDTAAELPRGLRDMWLSA